jgi:hypothetical protein
MAIGKKTRGGSRKGVPDAGIAKSDAGAQLREMILGALDNAGGEDWLRRHGGDHLIPGYRRERERRLGLTPENSGS